MALTLLFGTPGGGKTYTAVEKFVLPALFAAAVAAKLSLVVRFIRWALRIPAPDSGGGAAAGFRPRRVLHNIGGLRLGIPFGAQPVFPIPAIDEAGHIRFRNGMPEWEIKAECENHGITDKVPIERLQALRGERAFYDYGKISLADWRDGHSFRDMIERRVLKANVVRGGDLVVIDEFFLVKQAGVGFLTSTLVSRVTKNPWVENFQAFLRAHRHFISADGIATDIVIISQTDDDLDAGIAKCAEKTIVCKTHPIFARSLRRMYFQGAKSIARATAAAAVQVEPFTPRPSVYKHYQSYTADEAIRVREMHRGFGLSVFFKKPMLLTCGLLFVLIYGWSFFNSAAFFGNAGRAVSSVSPSAARFIPAPRPHRAPRRCVFAINGDCELWRAAGL